MANQIVVSAGAKVRNLSGVLTATSGVVSFLPIDVSLGIPQLDVNGKILVSQLPNSVMEYQGTWNATTNVPYLVNGVGNAGDVWLVSTGGVHDFGAGAITFVVSDQVIFSNVAEGSIWQKASGSNGTVTSVAVTETGDSLNITGSPITTSGTINIGFNGTNLQYVNGAGNLTTFPILTGYVTAVSGTAPVVSSGGTTPAISMAAATGSVDGYLLATDFAIFSAKQSALTFSSPLVNTSGTISIPAATTSVNGYLASADFTTFNNKQNTITLTTTGTSGASTLVGATLNIPNYSSALTGYVPYTGATANVDLGVFDLTADLITGATGSFASNGGSDTFAINHSSGGGIALNITKGGSGEGLYINKTSGSGNAATIIGTLNATTLVKSGGTSSQFLKADGTVDSNTYALDSLVVHLAGTETITGAKTFSGYTTFTSTVDITSGLTFSNSGFTLLLQPPTLSVNRTVTLPNGTGTLALTSDISYPVTSVFGRTGAVVATSGDYTTAQVTESGNLYFTDSRARLALSFVAGSGAYNSTTGVITIPTNNTQITNGSNYITLTSLSGSTGISYNNTTGAISSTITQYTDALARLAISLTTTGTSGAATYNSTTGVLNIPQYIGGVTSVFGRTGAVVATEGDYSLTQLSDVTITSPTTGQVLKYNGTAWINDTDANSGTVTSVAMTVPTGLSVSGSPITSSGTLGVTFTAGYSIPTDASQTTWDTAYTNRITSLTVTGASGAATLVSNVLNIPTYTLTGLGGQPLATNLTSLAGLTFVSTSFVKMTAAGTFALDTNTYQGALTLTTTGTSGAATLVGNTLNIPQYSGGGTITLSAIGSTPNANAATLTGSALNLEPASASFGGVVTTGTQTFAGVKAFNNNVGIGSSTIYNGGGFGNVLSIFNTTSSAVSLVTSSRQLQVGLFNANFTMYDVTSAVDRFTIIGTTGNIGINTTSVGSKLQVNGNAAIGYSASTAAPTNGLAVSGDVGIGKTSMDNATTGIELRTIGLGIFQRVSGVPLLVRRTTTTGQLLAFSYGSTGVGDIGTNGTDIYFNVDIATKLGVGTTTIGSKLQVNGNAAIGYSASTAAPTNGLAVSGSVGIGVVSPNQKLHVDSTSGDGVYISSFQTTTGAINTGPSLYFGFHDGGGARDGGNIKLLKENGTSSNYATYMSFATRANGSAVAEVMRLASSGAATFTSSVTATSFFESSDSRLKTLIQDNYQTKGIASITPKLYTKNGKVELGYYAQDLVGVLDSAVVKGNDDMLSLSYREVLVAKVYALEQRIKELETK